MIPYDPAFGVSELPTQEEIAALYNDEFNTALAKKWGIDQDQHNLAWWLRRGAHRYVIFGQHHPQLTSKERRQQNEKIARASQRLSELLRQTTFEFEHELDQLPEFSKHRKNRNAAHRLEDFVKPQSHPYGRLQPMWFVWDRINASRYEIECISRAADRAASKVVPDKGGRPTNAGLRQFVMYLGDFWTWHLGRKLTIDSHKGQGTTEAFQFLYDCISPFLKFEDKALISAMRSYREDGY